MTATVAVAAVLAALAVVKTLERHLPRIVVRAGIAVFVVGPLLGAAYAMWALWRQWLAPVDLALLGSLAVITGLGTSLGYHRLLTYRSFRTTPWTASCMRTWAGSLPSARPSGSATATALIDGWRGLLWGGIVRIAIHNHTMFAVTSICHAFGPQPFQTGDESRNTRLIAALAFGEGWHNNHHAFPAAAHHGMGRHPDVTGMVIRALERTGLAWDVHRPSASALARRQARPIVGIPAGITRSE